MSPCTRSNRFPAAFTALAVSWRGWSCGACLCRACSWLVIGGFCLLTLPAAARADEVILSHGGKIKGELLNPDESPRQKYVIETAKGARVTLGKDQVKEVIRPRAVELEYARLRPTHADTVDGQWQLAEWCRENHLSDLRKVHLQRVIELSPDHEQARRALEYQRTDKGWQTRDEIKAERGQVMYKGRYRTQQEIDLMERKRVEELSSKQWFRDLKLWRGWLDSERADEGAQKIASIENPFAIAALAEFLGREPNENVRALYIEALGRINTPAALKVLALSALHDPVEEVRLTCLDYLKQEPRPEVTALFCSGLKHKDNAIVNRAAVGLSAMGDTSAIGPLIDALITTHKEVLNPGAGSGQYSASFSPNGGGSGISAGSRGPSVVYLKLRNSAVLDALVALTDGTNYDFHIPQWKSWHAAQRRQSALDARRDAE